MTADAGKTLFHAIHLLVCFSLYSLKCLGARCFCYTLWEQWRATWTGGRYNFYVSQSLQVEVGASGICLALILGKQALHCYLACMFI